MYNDLLVSAVQQDESVTQTRSCRLFSRSGCYRVLGGAPRVVQSPNVTTVTSRPRVHLCFVSKFIRILFFFFF